VQERIDDSVGNCGGRADGGGLAGFPIGRLNGSRQQVIHKTAVLEGFKYRLTWVGVV
jgi:hypothetical protein